MVALPAKGAIDLRARISNRPIQSVEAGVIRAGQPRGTGAILPTVPGPRIVTEFPRARNGVPPPYPFSGGGVVGVEKTARAEFPARHADDDFIFYDQRRARNAVA